MEQIVGYLYRFFLRYVLGLWVAVYTLSYLYPVYQAGRKSRTKAIVDIDDRYARRA